MELRRVKLYRPCGALIGEAEVPDIPGVCFGVLIWDGRAFIRDPSESPWTLPGDLSIFREAPMWKLDKHAVKRLPDHWQEEPPHEQPDR